MNPLELTGRASTHVTSVPELGVAMHQFVVAPFAALREAAAAAGFDLRPVSGFRDFARQATIWNGKFTGARPALDAAGDPLDLTQLPPPARIDAILCWSALPGASRHHWGTDLDLIDAAATAPDYRPGLTLAEFSAGGPYARASDWLERHAGRFGFFRPYRGIASGVQAEPWHFSFAPVADAARRALSPALLREALADSMLEGKEWVLERLAELHARYVAAIDWP